MVRYADLSPAARERERARKRRKGWKEATAAANRKNYVKRKSVIIECTNEEVKEFMRLNPFCARCDSTDNLTLNHIIPVSWGFLSRHSLDNFQVLCNSCNTLKGNRVSIDYRLPILE